MAQPDSHPQNTLSPSSIRIWRILQFSTWCVGMGIFLLLLFVPTIGIHAFWNVLIPVAPALVVFLPGLWRNICPLASTALTARHVNLSARRILSNRQRDWLNLAGVILLLALVPMRHVVMDTSGLATALVLAGLALLSIGMGLVYEWKSGWCSGLCPIHPVEKFYGSQPLLSLPNAHCDECEECLSICPDSTPTMHPFLGAKSFAQKAAATIMIGGFAGFIWGWFQVPDFLPSEGWRHWPQIYGYPLIGGVLVQPNIEF